MPKRWNREALKALYVSGMSLTEILELKEYEGLTRGYLEKLAYTNKWAKEKERVSLLTQKALSEAVATNVQDEVTAHYTFVLKQLSDERAIIQARSKTTTMKDQQERLALLEKYIAMAHKALNLDDVAPGDKNRTAYQSLVLIQNISTAPMALKEIQRKAMETPLELARETGGEQAEVVLSPIDQVLTQFKRG